MKRRESVGLWIALAILAAVGILAYRSIDATAEALARVEHAHRVLEQLQEVSAAYSRAAGARRSYVIAGDDSQLSDAHNLDARLVQGGTTLRSLLADEPVQLRLATRWLELLQQRVVDLDHAVAQRRGDGTSGEGAAGLALLAEIRTVREQIERQESEQLANRDARTRTDVTRTKIAEIVGTLTSFALILFVFGRLRQEVARRQVSEHAHRASETFLDSIVENIPNMIFVKDARELRFERINRAGEKLLGIERRELIQKNDFDFFPREQAEAFQHKDHETLERKLVVDIVEEPVQTTRGERWLHTKKVPILDENGAPKFLLGISEDITEARIAGEALKTANSAAEAANRELEAFSYSVAHDLRSPLRAIDGFSLALEEDCSAVLDKDSLDHLRRVRAAAQHMARLIDGLLGLSRVTRGEIAHDPIDLSQLARDSEQRLRDAQPERVVEFVIEPGLMAQGDDRLLTAALDNLLSNAWKFTRKKSAAKIEVGSVNKDNQRVFFVRDNGAGFDQSFAHNLFGAFQRLHNVREFEGTGIGLATVQRIVRRHGGQIWAEGVVDSGATFYFTL